MKSARDLNSAQKQAVTHAHGPLLIVAGAGTGKTTVITRRIAWLIAEKLARPEEILALTFTDKAAGEMEERVDRLLPIGYVDVWISTFHSFGERMLKDYGLDIGLPNDFRVLTRSQQWLMIRNNLARFSIDYYRPLGNPTKFISALLQHFSRAKDEEIAPEQYLEYAQGLKLDTDADVGADGDEIKRVREIADAYHVYQQLLLENSALDFGDLINYTLRLLRERPRALKELRAKFKYILVDEFQDTNWAQYELIKLLAAPENNITVVGDDDQSVYKFRGASISNILDFKRDFPDCKEIFLAENYRSYQNILDTAYTFIQQNNPYRLEVKLAEGKGSALSKKLKAARVGEGEVVGQVYRSAQDEAEGVVKKILELHNAPQPPLNLRGGEGGVTPSWSDFAILLRANSSAPIFLKELKRHNIPFEYVANKGLYFEPIIQEVLDYLRFLDNHSDSHILYRVLTRKPFEIPHEDLVRLSAHAHQKTISLYEALHALVPCSPHPNPLPKGEGIPSTPPRPAGEGGGEGILSTHGQESIKKLFTLLTSHTKLTRERSAAEVYVQVVHDLGMEERVAEPWGARDAQYLASFYERIKQYEIDENDHTLHGFLSALTLEMEAGEEGTLPTDTEEGPDTVKITTIHSAKGLEWRYVFIPHLIDRRFPSVERREPIEVPSALIKETLPEGDVHLQEERRLFYVAMTRARDGVYLTRAENYFGKTTRRPSRFLVELGMVKEDDRRQGQSLPRQGLSLNMIPAAPSTLARYPIPESFSFSSVSAFLKCPLDFKMRYLLRLPMPGTAYMSFGVTIHKTLEEFLKLWQQRMRMAQGQLFGVNPPPSGGAPPLGGGSNLPTFDELKSIYEHVWLDDWYETPAQKKEYREEKGPQLLKNFYAHFSAAPPNPKHLEKFFKISMGTYKFVGKIDRIDSPSPPPSPAGRGGSQATPLPAGEGGRRPGEGITIIDYKTGQSAAKKINKVDRDQLIIYQIAAQEFLGESVKNLQYWYLDPNQFSEPFAANDEQIAEIKERYLGHIEQIVDTVKRDAFEEAHESAGQHECRYTR